MSRGNAARVAGALSVTMVVGVLSGCAQRATGPLDPGEPMGSVVPTVQVSAPFSDGFTELIFSGSEPVTIDRVVSVGNPDELKPVGALLAGDDRASAAIQFDATFPPTDPDFGTLMPAEGATIDPRPGPTFTSWALVLGYEVTEPGMWTRKGIDVHYTVGGEQFVAHLPAELVVCTPTVAAQCDEYEEGP
ncbi:MAG TPA: hypothetical protein VM307_12700 [Egibacteraceae bacterium]|nr:hypothetical protein [Egibacteraceae bacterium]